jgi:hypothetical protein
VPCRGLLRQRSQQAEPESAETRRAVAALCCGVWGSTFKYTAVRALYLILSLSRSLARSLCVVPPLAVRPHAEPRRQAHTEVGLIESR